MTIWQEPCLLSPSLITLDLLNLEQQVQTLAGAGFSNLHLDILDGYFSPSMPLGLDTVRQLRQVTDLAFDCHVMAGKNDFFIEELLDIGVDQISFHLETEDHIDHKLSYLRSHGIRAGVALKPATSLSSLEYILDKCDVVLLMLINPGFASSAQEKQVAYAGQKIQQLREMIDRQGCETKIMIDGRVSPANIREYSRGLVDQFVCGSTCLDRHHLAQTAEQLMEFRKQLLEE